MGRQCHQPDVVLYSTTETLPSTEVASPLPMVDKNSKYLLFSQDSILQTLKQCRQLKVKGSVTSGKLIVSIQTAEDTPRLFEFENVESFELVEDLLKDDKIVFSYIGSSTVIVIKAKIVKKY